MGKKSLVLERIKALECSILVPMEPQLYKSLLMTHRSDPFDFLMHRIRMRL